MDVAYVFGAMGNLSHALGNGWSIEEHFAWAVGAESRIVLPLPGDDTCYLLRLEVHPLTLPGAVSRQRLTIWLGKTILGSFQMTARQTIAIPLPLELTRRRHSLDLTLVHPDAVRPSDYRHGDDLRLLALCFHSASLTRRNSSGADASSPTHATELEPIHGLIAGDFAARRIGDAISKLPALRGRFGIRVIDLSEPFDKATEHLPPDTLETAQFCWLNRGSGTPASRNALLRRLSADCTPRTFYTPSVQALWPFLAPDPRAVPEPGRYHSARYPFGDRIGMALQSLNIPDDVVALMYQMSAAREPLDLDAMFADDLARWRLDDNRSDIKLADFIARHFQSARVFLAPTVPGPVLLREMIRQVLSVPVVQDLATPDVLSAELDVLLQGFVGWREEWPVQKRVAAHFGLTWWSPDIKYRWHGNRYSGLHQMINYIRWNQWRP